MSRNRKHRKTFASSPAPGPALLMKAQEALRAGHFKEAIEHYKELLKQVRNPSWLSALAEAYAGRAGQLAAKDMVKEAVALWRTRADSCGVPLLQGPYLKWLMQAGEWEQMFGLLSRPEALPPGVQAQIETQLAGGALLAPEDILRQPLLHRLLSKHIAAVGVLDPFLPPNMGHRRLTA